MQKIPITNEEFNQLVIDFSNEVDYCYENEIITTKYHDLYNALEYFADSNPNFLYTEIVDRKYHCYINDFFCDYSRKQRKLDTQRRLNLIRI